MDSSFDLITVGNARIDLFLSIQDTNKHFRLNEQNQELCIRYGDKAPIDKLEVLPGGNASNVAVGVSRLGFKSAIIAEIGTDEFSQKIVNNLKSEGVFDTFLKKNKNVPSLISVIINYKVDRTIFTEFHEMEHDFFYNGLQTKWIYLTSLAKKWEHVYEKIVDFCKKTGTKLAFNPGTLQLDDSYEKIREAFKICELLFVNKEEAKSILTKNGKTVSKEEMEDLLLPLKELGPKTVIITDGINGSCSVNQQNEIFSCGIIESKAIERTGAGDSYAAGFLSAILAGQNYNTAMTWGAKNSSSVVTKVGAQTGLLTKEKIENE
jgi:sugar/nucleoside kinase (ribokinase family)